MERIIRNPGFYITGKKGFHIKFENGWSMSVQFGPGNYCDNYDMDIGADDEEAGRRGSSCAEIAMLAPNGELSERIDTRGEEYKDTVAPRKTPAEVLAMMNICAALSPDDKP